MMEIKKENCVAWGYDFTCDFTVKSGTPEYRYLNELYFTQEKTDGLFKTFGFNGLGVVVGCSSYARDDAIYATFTVKYCTG